MKNIFFGLLAIICMQCKQVDDLLTFTIANQVAMTVPSNSPLNLPLELATPEVATNSSQTFANNNTEASLVKDVKLQELKLTITSPAGKTFSFLKSIQVYISTTSNNEILLASLDNIPSTASTISLTPTQQKLDVYAKASSYKLRTAIVTRETVTQSVDMNADLKFRVTAAPL
ncbi:MAG TPA: hypothetical protein VGD40_09150 [Chryseosolibacter sp.]